MKKTNRYSPSRLQCLAFASDVLHVTSITTTTTRKHITSHLIRHHLNAAQWDKRYTLEQLASWFHYHFEVGSDYTVVKATDKEVKVRVTDKIRQTVNRNTERHHCRCCLNRDSPDDALYTARECEYFYNRTCASSPRRSI